MEDNKPTETQGTPIVPADMAEWDNKSMILESGVTDEQGNDVRKAEETEEEVEEQNNDDEGQVVEEYNDPEPIVTVEDPGEYTPKDYSFEVTIYDEEGKNGKPVKIKSVEEFEELLEKDSNFGSPSALLKAQRQATKMESNSERDKEKWQEAKDKYSSQVESVQAQQEQINNIASEISYLVAKGKLPEVDKKYSNADWSDPDIAKQPGVKEQVELLNYMRKENDARTKAGLKPLTSALDAYNSLQLEQRDRKVSDVKKRAGEVRKEAGSRIAGNSPSPVTNSPKGVAVGRGGSLRDLDSEW